MKCSVGPFCALVLLFALLSGCTPAGRSQSDEEKDPHFLAGKSRINSMDFAGAIESFKRALQANPNSAMAHFELGWLYDRKQGDPAAAIYHYENYLRLRPKAENAEIVRQIVLACKQELARTVSLGPVTERQQRELEKLVEDNKKLTEERKQLIEELQKLRVALAVQPQATEAAGSSSARQGSAVSGGPPVQEPAKPVQTRARTVHRVQSGETLSSIARRYGKRLDSITAANPGVNPKKLRVGQEVVVP